MSFHDLMITIHPWRVFYFRLYHIATVPCGIIALPLTS